MADPIEEAIAMLSADPVTSALFKSMWAMNTREVEHEVWAPCSPHRTIIAANCESAARRYVRRHHSPGDAPREVFVRRPGGLRLVGVTYTTAIHAEVTHG